MVGRPTKYNAAITKKICVHIMNMKSLRKIGAMEDMPCTSSITNWLASKPAFLEKYLRAKEIQAYNYADHLLDIADDVIKGDTDPHAARVAADIYKWAMAKSFPKVYGDRTEIDHTGRVIVQPAPIDKPAGSGE